MKHFLILCLIVCLFTSCDNANRSAFIGETQSRTNTPVGTLHEESIYNLTDTFTTQDGSTVTLRDFAGRPTVISMIFTHCAYACPRLTADIQAIEEQLGKEAGEVHFVLVSFDSERDTPERLAHFKNQMKLGDRFTLLHGDEEAVRTLSVLMNLQFQKNADGDFSHSNLISVLDREGRLIFQKEGIHSNHEQTVSALTDLLKNS